MFTKHKTTKRGQDFYQNLFKGKNGMEYITDEHYTVNDIYRGSNDISVDTVHFTVPVQGKKKRIKASKQSDVTTPLRSDLDSFTLEPKVKYVNGTWFDISKPMDKLMKNTKMKVEYNKWPILEKTCLDTIDDFVVRNAELKINKIKIYFDSCDCEDSIILHLNFTCEIDKEKKSIDVRWITSDFNKYFKDVEPILSYPVFSKDGQWFTKMT